MGKERFGFGDRIQLTDEKGRMISFTLNENETFHTHKGFLKHNDIVGKEEGSILITSSGMKFQAFKPLYSDYVLGMKRGATIVYPKDSALILGFGDLKEGLNVVEAGVGSGALSIAILRAIGRAGFLHSYEIRRDFAEIATKNVRDYFGEIPGHWDLTVADVAQARDSLDGEIDRVILDMLAPWDQIGTAARLLRSGGVLIVYVATTTQLSRVAEKIKESGAFTEPESFETLLRQWHHEGLAVRPAHSMNAHTGFILTSRRVGVDGVLERRRRPAKGAYSEEF